MSANTPEPPDDHKALIRTMALDRDAFLGMTLSRKLYDDGTPWIRIRLRPVLIRGERKVQFSYFSPTKDITGNFSDEGLRERLDEALAMPFARIHLQSTSGDVHVRVTRKGRALVTRGKPSRAGQEPDLSHDRVKRHALAPDSADGLLQALGILTRRGGVRSSMRGKFRQINEFLRVVEQTLPPEPAQDTDAAEPLHVVDCGCGSAYLTFAARHYLDRIRGRRAHLVGIDSNREVIDKCRALRDRLGWEDVEFHVSSIADFEPAFTPAMVLSLHACDTATDEAIARAIQWKSRVILAAPCCQHELHQQLNARLFRPMLRHGILKERLADLLADTFRAMVLRIMGYRTSVIEFVSPDATSKNIMIRAEKGGHPGHPAVVQEYLDLRDFWEASPHVEGLLGEEFTRRLNVS